MNAPEKPLDEHSAPVPDVPSSKMKGRRPPSSRPKNPINARKGAKSQLNASDGEVKGASVPKEKKKSSVVPILPGSEAEVGGDPKSLSCLPHLSQTLPWNAEVPLCNQRGSSLPPVAVENRGSTAHSALGRYVAPTEKGAMPVSEILPAAKNVDDVLKTEPCDVREASGGEGLRTGPTGEALLRAAATTVASRDAVAVHDKKTEVEASPIGLVLEWRAAVMAEQSQKKDGSLARDILGSSSIREYVQLQALYETPLVVQDDVESLDESFHSFPLTSEELAGPAEGEQNASASEKLLPPTASESIVEKAVASAPPAANVLEFLATRCGEKPEDLPTLSQLSVWIEKGLPPAEPSAEEEEPPKGAGKSVTGSDSAVAPKENLLGDQVRSSNSTKNEVKEDGVHLLQPHSVGLTSYEEVRPGVAMTADLTRSSEIERPAGEDAPAAPTASEGIVEKAVASAPPAANVLEFLATRCGEKPEDLPTLSQLSVWIEKGLPPAEPSAAEEEPPKGAGKSVTGSDSAVAPKENLLGDQVRSSNSTKNEVKEDGVHLLQPHSVGLTSYEEVRPGVAMTADLTRSSEIERPASEDAPAAPTASEGIVEKAVASAPPAANVLEFLATRCGEKSEDLPTLSQLSVWIEKGLPPAEPSAEEKEAAPPVVDLKEPLSGVFSSRIYGFEGTKASSLELGLCNVEKPVECKDSREPFAKEVIEVAPSLIVKAISSQSSSGIPRADAAAALSVLKQQVDDAERAHHESEKEDSALAIRAREKASSSGIENRQSFDSLRPKSASPTGPHTPSKTSTPGLVGHERRKQNASTPHGERRNSPGMVTSASSAKGPKKEQLGIGAPPRGGTRSPVLQADSKEASHIAAETGTWQGLSSSSEDGLGEPKKEGRRPLSPAACSRPGELGAEKAIDYISDAAAASYLQSRCRRLSVPEVCSRISSAASGVELPVPSPSKFSDIFPEEGRRGSPSASPHRKEETSPVYPSFIDPNRVSRLPPTGEPSKVISRPISPATKPPRSEVSLKPGRPNSRGAPQGETTTARAVDPCSSFTADLAVQCFSLSTPDDRKTNTRLRLAVDDDRGAASIGPFHGPARLSKSNSQNTSPRCIERVGSALSDKFGGDVEKQGVLSHLPPMLPSLRNDSFPDFPSVSPGLSLPRGGVLRLDTRSSRSQESDLLLPSDELVLEAALRPQSASRRDDDVAMANCSRNTMTVPTALNKHQEPVEGNAKPPLPSSQSVFVTNLHEKIRQGKIKGRNHSATPNRLSPELKNETKKYKNKKSSYSSPILIVGTAVVRIPSPQERVESLCVVGSGIKPRYRLKV